MTMAVLTKDKKCNAAAGAAILTSHPSGDKRREPRDRSETILTEPM